MSVEHVGTRQDYDAARGSNGLTLQERVPLYSRRIRVDGISTHYLEAGDGPEVVVLLHAGGWGQSAALTWERNIPTLAAQYRVIAPDWLGFGETDKIRDFVSGSERMVAHMARTIETLGIDSAHFVGSSMGASYLLREAARKPCRFPIKRMVLCSGGGFVPDNEARRSTLDYDGSPEQMREILRASFHTPIWDNDDYVGRRVRNSLSPGAWECVAAARFKAPHLPPRSGFGQPDLVPHHDVTVPTLIIAGEFDKLREPGYEKELADRLAQGESYTVRDAGHMHQIEKPDEVNQVILDYLGRNND